MATGDTVPGNSVNDEYFKSYANLEVHELMINDKPRTLAYKQFLEKNVNLIKGKVVLDVGAGTGILSLFAARSGAKKVYAVEASDVADLCKEIVKVNKYDQVVTVVKGVMEEIELPEKVDVIISEWMGFYLLHESMLESVLHARDKWLKGDGIMLPSHAGIYACPVNMSDFLEDNINCWADVYDFDFSPLLVRKVGDLLQQPAVVHVREDQLLSACALVARFDLKHMELSEIVEVEEQMSFSVNSSTNLHGFAVWFDVRFTPDLTERQYGLTCIEKAKTEQDGELLEKTQQSIEKSQVHHVTLSTAPSASETHWKQTVCFLPVAVSVTKSDAVYCKLSLSQERTHNRHYNISLEMLEGLELSDLDLDDDEEETEHHPVPCDCGAGRCSLIRAIVEKYDVEQTELEMEAEFTDVSAEVQAAQTLDNDSSYLDSGLSLQDDLCSNSTNSDKQ